MSEVMHPLLAATSLLDVHHANIEWLVAERGWRVLRPYDRIGAVYDFVRNEITFGYNEGETVTVAGGPGGTGDTQPSLRAPGVPRSPEP